MGSRTAVRHTFHTRLLAIRGHERSCRSDSEESFTVPRFEEAVVTQAIKAQPAGEYELAVSLSPVPEDAETMLGRFPLRLRNSSVAAARDIEGGWLLRAGGGRQRAARFALAGQEIFSVAFDDVEKTPWPWLLYVFMERERSSCALLWNGHPLRDSAAASGGAGRQTIVCEIPREFIHPAHNELTLLCSATEGNAFLRLGRVVLVSEEATFAEGGDTVISLAPWRFAGASNVRAKTLTCIEEPRALERRRVHELRGRESFLCPIILGGYGLVGVRSAAVLVTITGTAGMEAPELKATLNDLPLELRPATDRECAGRLNRTVGFTADSKVLAAGVNRLRLEAGGARGKSVWWLRGAQVIMEGAE